MDHLLHAGYRPHPAGLLLLHRAAAGGGGASGEETDAAAGEQDQAAAKPAAGKDSSTMMDESLATMGAKKRHYRLRAQQRSQFLCAVYRHFRRCLLTATFCCYILPTDNTNMYYIRKLFIPLYFFLCNLCI